MGKKGQKQIKLLGFMNLCWVSLMVACLSSQLMSDEKIKVLIIDGRNNHDWEKTTESLVGTLNESGLFKVGVSSAPAWTFPDRPRRPRNPTKQEEAAYTQAVLEHQKAARAYGKTLEGAWSRWNPDFSKYDTVLLNYNGQTWNPDMQKGFTEFVKNGGGVVLIHAANNAFSGWQEFNEMIGIGWRKPGSGPCVTLHEDGKVNYETCNQGSGHGSKHPFQVQVREPEHPIMKGLPKLWLHGSDELYHRMQGPAKNLTVLSTAYSDPKQRGTGLHEPITWEVAYGKGKVIVTSMGHFWRGETNYDSLNCVGFQTVLTRSVEYTARGKVSSALPKDFPKEQEMSLREPTKSAKLVMQAKKYENPYCMLTPEQELATFTLPEGYVAECIASEPQVEEPVLTVWDRDGAMYVAEMRSYMQDADGTGTKTLRNGRVKKLVDTNGDGNYDQVTIFADGLNLPRMILPLDDWIAIRETDTTDVVAYRDNDGDGVSDERKVLYAGGPKGRNGPGKSVEHQDSGLLWNLDNYIYVTYNTERYRYTKGEWKMEPQRGHWTQWGLTNDDSGHLYWIHNSGPLAAAQLLPRYWSTVNRLAERVPAGLPIDLGNPYAPDFMKVKSHVLLNDRGGSAPEVRSFTSACGQTVFRGTALKDRDYGTYFACDPTIHVVRQANIVRDYGKLMLEKTQEGSNEFLLSSDINSRFVNTATGPDGSLYVTDMYRGIIQDAPWMNSGARAFTRKSGLADHRMHGRIWRIRYVGKELESKPNYSKATSADLVKELNQKNGWKRQEAQKQLIFRGSDKATIAQLREVLDGDQALAIVHALWTLEGLAQVNGDDLFKAVKDGSEKVRLAAIKIGESSLEALDFVKLCMENQGEENARVAEQMLYSLGTLDLKDRLEVMQKIAQSHMQDRGVMLATLIGLWGMKDLSLMKGVENGSAFSTLEVADQGRAMMEWKAAKANWNRGLKFPEGMSSTERRRIQGGETLFYKHCVTCHGADGKGSQVPGTELAMAPSLVGSPRVVGQPHQLIPIMINGLTGPLDGKVYTGGFMAPAKALGITRDDRLSELLSFIRFAWGQNASSISADDVKNMRKKHEARTLPWTQGDLESLTN